MKTKLTVKQAIINHVKSTPNATVKTVTANIKKPTNQLHTSVWKMVKDGTLNKDANGVLTLAEPLSHVPVKTTKRKATPLEMGLGRRVNGLEAHIAELQNELRKAQTNYFDAMAVIMYLEAKLISVIK